MEPATPSVAPPASPGRFTGHDPVTGLPDVAALRERFDATLAATQREGKRLGILSVALDGIGHVVHEFGESAGDAALRHVARRLNASIWGSDIACRHGDAGFVVLLTELSTPAAAARVAERILGSLMAPEHLEGHTVSLLANIGISLCPEDGRTLDELIQRADEAMRQARRRGSGHYVFHDGGEPSRDQRVASAARPDGGFPPAVMPPRERRRQDQMQHANEQLLLAALSARELQSAAERALGEQLALMARVAHELRNPLTPIRSAASLLDRVDVRELPRLRAVIERQVDDVSRLVGDLLDLTRSQAGKLRLQRTVVDMRGVAEAAVSACRPAMDVRHQHLRVDLPGQPTLVDGDRVRLVQVLSNLLDNASRYTPAEGTITLAVHEAGDEVTVAVSDNGIGIRAESIAGIFHPFVQDNRATSFNGAGLGIGLTVVRELAEAHGGRVQAFSAGEGCGSQFVLTLPRYRGEAEAETKAATREADEGA